VIRATQVVSQRLLNQKLTSTAFRRPEAVVGWLGAVQSQDYTGAKWALGQRTKGAGDADIERAFDDGRILRTHVLRPTWHFVLPADIRWMLALTGPRVNAISASYFRKAGLDEAIFSKSRKIIERALGGGHHLTRAELATLLRRSGIDGDPLRISFLMLRAELDAVVCSGPRRGKQFTYALVDERVPPVAPLGREASLAELAGRYFTSHGPATVKDYVWWSGLTVKDATMGIDMARPVLVRETIGDLTCWSAKARAAAPLSGTTAWLLPNYDEYLIAYKDRQLVGSAPGTRKMDPESRDAYAHLLVIDGRLAGIWRRVERSDSVAVSVTPYRTLTRADRRAIEKAAERYGAFLGLPARLTIA
jgi:hypothetical protein